MYYICIFVYSHVCLFIAHVFKLISIFMLILLIQLRISNDIYDYIHVFMYLFICLFIILFYACYLFTYSCHLCGECHDIWTLNSQ